MDTWWWLSVPYTITFQIFILVFPLEEYSDLLGPLFLIAYLTGIISVVWMLVTIWPLIVSRNMQLAYKKKIKIGFGLLSVVLWIVIFLIVGAHNSRSLHGG
jgi:hypothetical protein